MGFWKRKDGTMVEMVFDENLEFVEFGGNITEEEAREVEKEIFETLKEQKII